MVHEQEILTANEKDLQKGEEAGLTKALLDRLALNHKRIEAMAEGLRSVVNLPDPIGDIVTNIRPQNGLNIIQKRVPLGVIGIIYEARPNVTVDACGLCLKSGNAVVLRGSSSAFYSNQKIVEVIKGALENSQLPAEAVQLVGALSHEEADQMLKLHGFIDVLIPRGGAGLIKHVVHNATIPVIETGAGICHTYIDASADYEMAISIALNAKVQRPSVCNAMETLLVHEDFATTYLHSLVDAFTDAGVQIRADKKAQAIVTGLTPAQEEDWDTEYNDYILNLRVIEDLDAALDHIDKHSTKHSECIITEDPKHAARFLQEVDAAAVYHNASTRFTDGFEFGFGAEIGISTQKLHARGPMGLEALTSYKYCIEGTGEIRN